MISIIIPVYNQANKLKHCLESILKQSYDNYEVIVVNDRSRDGVEKVMETYKRRLGIRFKSVHNLTNHGAPYSRNKGFRSARGEFVMFCDADAVLEPQMLKRLHDALHEHKEAAFAYSSHKFGFKTFGKLEYSPERLRSMPFIHTTALIRRECFPAPGFDETLKRLQDWDLWLTMLEAGHQGIWVDEVLFSVQSGGTMSSWLPSFVYKIFPFLPSVRKYKKAVEIITAKHKLTITN